MSLIHDVVNFPLSKLNLKVFDSQFVFLYDKSVLKITCIYSNIVLKLVCNYYLLVIKLGLENGDGVGDGIGDRV